MDREINRVAYFHSRMQPRAFFNSLCANKTGEGIEQIVLELYQDVNAGALNLSGTGLSAPYHPLKQYPSDLHQG